MSSLFSKLCPFLHAWVMYGDTPLDISCFTTFISVQYLTLCPPPSLTWDWPIHADFSIISASPLTDQFSSREILDTILKMTRHHASSFSHFLRHLLHTVLWDSLYRALGQLRDEDERYKKGVFCGVGVTLCYCHLMLQVTVSCSSLTNNKSKQRQHLLQLNSSFLGVCNTLTLSRQGLRGNRIFKILKGVKINWR